MTRLKIREKVFEKIVGHIELQSGVALNVMESIGAGLAADDIVRMVQNNYRRRKKA